MTHSCHLETLVSTICDSPASHLTGCPPPFPRAQPTYSCVCLGQTHHSGRAFAPTDRMVPIFRYSANTIPHPTQKRVELVVVEAGSKSIGKYVSGTRPGDLICLFVPQPLPSRNSFLMSSNEFGIVEQDRDPSGKDELPTYEDLAAQNGPNSRFGRWRGWIEKRAAERYADITPEIRERRREQGWDLPERPGPLNQQGQVPLHVQTSNLSLQDSKELGTTVPDDLSAPLPFVSEQITPSHLKINQFGSRFLPHATSQIRCILPLMGDRLVLIGHDEGLSVLDMFPQEWSDHGEILTKPPCEAQARLIWRGETIYQMTILELEESGEGAPQGVVLALVGPEPGSPGSSSDFRVLRMYNLSSLTSLARWAVAQQGVRPLDLYRPSNWQAQHQSSPRKHRQQGSIARSIKSLITDTPPPPEPTTSYQSFLTSPSTNPPSSYSSYKFPGQTSPVRHNSEDSGWDVVEDLPLRWATDFVPLASPGSRLASTSVISYATWTDKNRRSTGGQLLAIATKNSILLYETPKGERAYRFVKDFYTPIQPRSLIFFDQLVQQDVPPENQRHSRSTSGGSIRPVINEQNNGSTINYGTQLSLFVVFDKKAGWIRLADSAVGEFDLRDDGGSPPPAGVQLGSRDSLAPAISSMTQRTRSRLSFEIRESVARWTLPTRCELPVPIEMNHFSSNAAPITRPVYLLTRGRRTHILPCPLPSKSTSVTPIHLIYWKNTPRQISVRICTPSRGGITAAPRFSQHKPALFQAVAFGDAGLEVYETTVLSLFSSPSSNGKGKARASTTSVPLEAVRAEEDVGGEAGYLVAGGNWDQAEELYGLGAGLERSGTYGPVSASSFASSLDTDAIAGVLRDEVGMYGWCRKGSSDYRIFWVGGSYNDVDNEDDESFYEP